MKIMLVEDDDNIAEILKLELEKWNYDVVAVKEFNTIVDEFEKIKPHLILMDIILPYYNGYYWCQEIRKISKIPIVFISSKSEDMDVVMAMQFGGDDYISKPFNLEVVVAKIQAILRRSYDFINEINYINYKDINLYLSDSKISLLDKEEYLTKTELLIMEALFLEKGGIASREKIINRCWQSESFIDDNTLAVNITRLRKKLSNMGLGDLIITKKGMGYYLGR